jgi:parvulin-like peptidyl-prolyl isomerase
VPFRLVADRFSEWMMKRDRRFIFLCFFMGVLFLGSQKTWPQSAGPEAVPKPSAAAGVPGSGGQGVVATVNRRPITSLELDQAVNSLLPRAFGHRQLSESRVAEIKKKVLEDLIQKELLYQEANRRSIRVGPQEIDSEVSKIRRRFSSEKEFQAALEKSDLTLEKVRFGIERFLAIRKLLTMEVDSKVTVQEKDLVEYYEANPQRFTVPEEREIRQILVGVDPGGSEKAWDAGLEKANAILRKIKAGRDFAELARNESDDQATKDQGGRLGVLPRGGMKIKELEEAAFAMEVGRVSSPIKTLYGYFILKVEGVRPARRLAFSEVNQDLLREELRRQTVEERRRQWLEAIRAKADIKVFQ